jgi:hypothetical protein
VKARALALIAVAGGAAAETLDEGVPAATLIATCERFAADSTDGAATYCEAFVRGFVGALTVERALREQPSTPHAAFEERALRTRAGMRNRRIRPPPIYCVTVHTRIAEIVERLLDRGRTRSDLATLTAPQLLHELLAADFSCEG